MKTCVRIKGKESLLLPGRLQESLEPTHRRRVAVVWGAGTAMAHRAVDAVLGPRKLEIEHTTAAAPTPGGPCDIHAQAQAFQDVWFTGGWTHACIFIYLLPKASTTPSTLLFFASHR